ncbi:MAG TPA: fructosamine kinase family protein [Phycisphaerales bacterium]|nr:fructosamine kinase family protein [Phycisphaerales bacterium]
MPDLDALLQQLNLTCTRRTFIGSGASGSVLRLTLIDGSTLIAKLSTSTDLTLEARGLELLANHSRLPVPKPIHATRAVLLMQDMPGASGASGEAEEHAAALLADLHAVTEPQARYGLDFDNLIGPLPQRNTWAPSWPAFFRDHRLLPMTHAAAREGAISAALATRLERLASILDERLPGNPPATLIHGDIWSGNVLSHDGRITALLDPSPYYAHAEVELAFITLFSTFGQRFFGRYGERRPIDPDFWTTRRHLYNIYPLLVHARLFGESYAAQIDRTLDLLL